MSIFTKIDNLKVGSPYWIDIWWNTKNNYRANKPLTFVGIFLRLESIQVKRKINNSGLITVISPRRTVAWFSVNNVEVGVSSMNNFFAFPRFPTQELFERYVVRNLKLPTDLTRYMRRFIAHKPDTSSHNPFL